MSVGNDESVDTLVAFVTGALVGVAATLLVARIRRNRAAGAAADEDDYCYEGGDLFI